MSTETEESPMISWAAAELRRAGLFDKDSDYDVMLADAVMKLIREFCDEGHSGGSAYMTLYLFEQLSHWKPLTPLTDDPHEWNHVAEEAAGEPNLWQSARDGACFSHDGGKTYYDIDEKMSWWRRTLRRTPLTYMQVVKMHESKRVVHA